MAEKCECFVYMVCCKNDGLYTGITNSLLKRMQLHKGGAGARYISSHGFGLLVYIESVKSKGIAMKREHAIKGMPRKVKLELVHSELNLLAKYEQNRSLLEPLTGFITKDIGKQTTR